MSNLTSVDRIPKTPKHTFDIQLGQLSTLALGGVAADIRTLINRLSLSLRKSDASMAGVNDQIDFWRHMLAVIESHALYRDLRGER